MDTNPTQATPSPAEDIHLTSASSGSSIPIRAPLTIDSDSDSEFPLSIGNQIHCRTSSFSSRSSDISGYGSEYSGDASFHEEDGTLVTDPDEEVVVESSYTEEYAFTRPFVKYPDGVSVKNTLVEESVFVRPFVKIPDEGTIGESSGGIESFVAPAMEQSVLESAISLPVRLGVPIAQLTGDSDIDSVGSEVEESPRSDTLNLRIRSTGTVEKVAPSPKVKVVDSDEEEDDELQYEDASFDEDRNGLLGSEGAEATGYKGAEGTLGNDMVRDFVSAGSFGDVGSKVDEVEKVECSTEVVKHLESAEEVKSLGLSGGEEREMQVDSDMLGEDQKNRVLGFDWETRNLDDIKDSVLEKLGEDMRLDCDEATKGEPLVESDGSSMLNFLKLDDNVKNLNDESRYNLGKHDLEYFTSGNIVEYVELNSTNFECTMTDRDCNSSEILCSDEDVQLLDEEIQAFEGAKDGKKMSDSKPWRRETKQTTCQGVDAYKFVACNTSERLTLTVDNKEADCDPKGFAVDSEGEFGERFKPSFWSSGESFQRIDAQTVSDSDEVDALKERKVFDSASHECKETVIKKEGEMLEKMQQRRLKFMRLIQLLGLSTEDSLVAQVFDRLSLASGRPSILEYREGVASEIGEEGKSEFDFSLTILVIGKTGVGKSATINSIFGENKSFTNAFHPATTTVKEIQGNIDGINVRILDTPGLRSYPSEQSYNWKILSSIKRFLRKCSLDVVLYVDRLDIYTQDLNDLQLLRSITSSLGPSVWSNCVIALTHAASIPLDKPSGSALSYKAFVSQRYRFIQQLIFSHGVGDGHVVNPLCLVENHPFYKQNGSGQLLLPDGKSWKPQLLLLCYSVKILYKENSVSRASLNSLERGKLFVFTNLFLSLPYLNPPPKSSAQRRFSPNQNGEDIDPDSKSVGLMCCDQGDENMNMVNFHHLSS